MSTFDSLEYRLEKYKFEKIFGLKKIVWIWVFITVVFATPFYYFGNYFANIFYQDEFDTSQIYKEKNIPMPEFTISREEVLLLDNGERILYTKINNKKSNIGVFPWVYTYTVYDNSDNIVQKETVSSYILPNEETYIVIPVKEKRGLKLDITTDTKLSRTVDYNPNYKKFYTEPKINVTSQSLKESDAYEDYLDINFFLENESYFNLKKVDSFYIIRSIDQKIIGIGKYTLNDLEKYKEKEVNLRYPNPALGTNQNLEIVFRTNYLDIENMQIG